MIYIILIIFIVSLDQFTKFLIITNFNLYEKIPIIDDFVNITFVMNTGAAFSILKDKNELLLIFNLILLIILSIYLLIRRKKDSKLTLVSLSMLIGGGFGNIIDRFLRGYVVDFIQIGNFPIFNVGDICVVSGCILLVLSVLFSEKKNEISN